jgi:hypothetical protein
VGAVGDVLANAATEGPPFPLSPLGASAVSLSALSLAALAAPRTASGTLQDTGVPIRSDRRGYGALSASLLAVVIASVFLGAYPLLPTLTVTVAAPVLVLITVIGGPGLWRLIDPWAPAMACARRLHGGGSHRDTVVTVDEGTDVGPAVVVTAAGIAVLGLHPDPFSGAVVAVTLLCYSAMLLMLSVVPATAGWAERAHAVGLFMEMVGRTRRDALVCWRPARGVNAFLGIVVGGLLFRLLTDVLPKPVGAVAGPTVHATSVVALSLLIVFATALFLAGRFLVRDDPSALAAALVPVMAGLAICVALMHNLLFLGLRVVPTAVADPLGRGWTSALSTVALPTPVPAPNVLTFLQIVVLVSGGLLAVGVVRRRLTTQRDASVAIAAVAVVVAAASAAVVPV